jgi:hypothetical protein
MRLNLLDSIGCLSTCPRTHVVLYARRCTHYGLAGFLVPVSPVIRRDKDSYPSRLTATKRLVAGFLLGLAVVERLILRLGVEFSLSLHLLF